MCLEAGMSSTGIEKGAWGRVHVSPIGCGCLFPGFLSPFFCFLPYLWPWQQFGCFGWRGPALHTAGAICKAETKSASAGKGPSSGQLGLHLALFWHSCREFTKGPPYHTAAPLLWKQKTAPWCFVLLRGPGRMRQLPEQPKAQPMTWQCLSTWLSTSHPSAVTSTKSSTRTPISPGR